MITYKKDLVRARVSLSLFVGDVLAFVLAFYLSDILLIWLSGISAVSLYFPLDYGHFLDGTRFITFFSLGFVALLIFLGKGLYTQWIPWWSEVPVILKVFLFTLLLDGFLGFILDWPSNRILIVLNWAMSFFFILVLRQSIYFVLRKMRLWQIPTVIIGDSTVALDTLYAFDADRYTGYDVEAFFLRDHPDQKIDLKSLPARYHNLEILDNSDDYQSFIESHSDHFFAVTIETFRGKKKDQLVEIFESIGVRYAFIPSVKQTSFYQQELRHFFGNDILLLHAKERFFLLWSKSVKRLMDIVLSAIAIILFAPIFILVPLLLKLERQGGSVFYGGQRVGRDGQLFKCWKFRSMEPDTDHLLHEKLEQDDEARDFWERYHKLLDDPRVQARTARIIRKLSIDELPQLLNVFLGDMSLVGPRPILPSEKEAFGSHIENYISVRPGVTGLWQVSGRNGVSFERRVHWDSWYVVNWSLWSDIVILFKTVRVVLFGSGAH